MNRANRLRDLYTSALAEPTQSGGAWQRYLDFAASIYKYSFVNS
ncbi:hypothetical protein [Paenibacillus sp. SER-28]